MNHDSLDTFSEAMQAAWSPLDSALVTSARAALARLLVAPASEGWRRALVEDAPESRELIRDAAHGYVLLAHTEPTGLYRPPHDHGRGWVAYGVLRGELEMRTYRRVHDLRGTACLVERESFTLRPGDVRGFLPGDIHDTRCAGGPLTLLRFTSRDLKLEEVTRYPAPAAASDGGALAPSPARQRARSASVEAAPEGAASDGGALAQ